MRERFRWYAAFGVVAAVVAGFAVTGMGSVAAAIRPASEAASAKQYEEKVTICHRTRSKKNPFRTIRISRNALKGHMKHGDAMGPCPTAVFAMCHKTKSGKHKTVKVKGARKVQRQLKKGDKLGKCKARDKNKPEKNKPDQDKQKGKGKDKGKKKGKK
jgi:hypothetical protein